MRGGETHKDKNIMRKSCQRTEGVGVSGCTHEPTSHIENQVARPTGTLKHADETITHTQSHCDVQVGICLVGPHAGILTWVCIHTHGHTHTLTPCREV